MPGCVPIDLFNGAGTVTPQQIAYISFPLTDQGLNSQRLLNLDLQGDWLRLPAGSIAWATGFEYRKESGRYVYDPLRLGGVAGAPPSVQVPGGTITARDVYLEMRIPLLRDRPAAHSLDLDLGARYVDYSTFGGRTAWQGTLRWQPNTSLALHANYATVFRAPSLDESFGSVRYSSRQRSSSSVEPIDPAPSTTRCAVTEHAVRLPSVSWSA